jgi:hypothetical protein
MASQTIGQKSSIVQVITLSVTLISHSFIELCVSKWSVAHSRSYAVCQSFTWHEWWSQTFSAPSFPIIENTETPSHPTCTTHVHCVEPTWLHRLLRREGKHGNWMIWIHPRSVGGKEYQDGWSHIAWDHTWPSLIKMWTKYVHWTWNPAKCYLEPVWIYIANCKWSWMLVTPAFRIIKIFAININAVKQISVSRHRNLYRAEAFWRDYSNGKYFKT